MRTTQKIIINLFCALYLIAPVMLRQTADAQISPKKEKWVKVGRLHHLLRASTLERGYNGTYYAGLMWPAEYAETDNFVNKRFWVSCRDFTDIDNKYWPVKATALGETEDLTQFWTDEFRQVAQFEPTRVYVDGVEISETTETYADMINEIDPTLAADRMVFSRVHTNIGLTIERRVYVFSQQYHDNYFIYDYVFKNTGNIDGDEEIEYPTNTLQDVYIGMMVHYATSRDGAWKVQGRQTWGYNQWLTKRGEDYEDFVNGDTSADSLRCTFSWLGQDDKVSHDNIGAPDVQGGTGRWCSPQYAGIVFLHTDKSPNDPSDDPNQPLTVGWNGNDTFPRLSGTNELEMQNAYKMCQGLMMKGATDRMDDRMKDTKYPGRLTDDGGAAAVMGWGPYTLAPSDSFRFVYAEGVNGLNRQACIDFGRSWINEDSPYELPDGTVTNDADEFKNTWIYTGADSILQTFGRANRNYKSGYAIPRPPRPPSVFNVTSGGDRIMLEWTAESEDSPDFAGYRIFRAVGKPDTTYQEIFSCGAGTDNPAIVHSYDDIDAVRGYSYYYYITAFNDGSRNNTDLNPHGSLSSSRFYTQTSEPAYLRRQAAENLNDIRVVPNPYNIRARDLQYPGEENKIMFLNIPGQCTIRIFTDRGDLIKTINHTNGTGDEAWNLVTESRQFVVSGVYIAYFETPDGTSTFRKFGVIR
ncbi:fibronectin [candidate division KSB1 bacterium]|nr:fibronectin [candidate division KSB1 bacterium]